MPNVLLKNEIGEDVEYEGVDVVTLRRVEGGTASYLYGAPQPTDAWKNFQKMMNMSTLLGCTKYSLNMKRGRLVSTALYSAFGTWFQSSYDATRISTTCFTSMLDVGTGAILSTGASNSDMYFWDAETDELTLLKTNTGNVISSRQFHGKYFLACYQSWLLFDPETKELTELLARGTGSYGLGAFCYELEDCLLLSLQYYFSAEKLGVFRLDAETFELERVYDQGYYWFGQWRAKPRYYDNSTYVFEDDDCLLFTLTTSTTSYGCGGVLRYDKATHEVTKVIEDGYSWMAESENTRFSYATYTHYIPEHGMVISTTASYSYGVYWYDFETKEITKICDTGYFNVWYSSQDLVVGSNTSYGTLVYDLNEKEWYRIETSSKYAYCGAVVDGGIVVAGPNSQGLRFYDFETETTRQLLSTVSTTFCFACRVPGGALFSGQGSNSGVWFYSDEDQSFTQLDNYGYYWRMVRHGDAVLMGCTENSTSSYGMLYYKDGTITRINPNNNRKMCCIEPVRDGWVANSGYSSSTPRTFYVDAETGEYTELTTGVYNLGWWPSWQGPSAGRRDYNFHRQYGKYHVLMSHESSSFVIFDDDTHDLVGIYNWPVSSADPTTTVKYVSMNRPYPIQLDEHNILFLPSSGSSPVIFNTSTGIAYNFNSISYGQSYIHNNLAFPYYTLLPVDGGYLFFCKGYNLDQSASSDAPSQGVIYIDTNRMRAQLVFSSGYFDTTEEAPGGFYIYQKGTDFAFKLYFSNETHTITPIYI